MSEPKLLGAFPISSVETKAWKIFAVGRSKSKVPTAKVFPDSLVVMGARIPFEYLHNIERIGDTVTIVLQNDLRLSIPIIGEQVLSASNFQLMAWRAYKTWKKDKHAGSNGVMGY